MLKLTSRTNVDNHHIYLGLFHTMHQREYFLLNLMFEQMVPHDLVYRDDRPLQTRAHDGPMFRLPSLCSSVFTKSYLYQGMVMWNQLPISIRNIGNYESFKKQIKQMLRERGNDV